MITLTPKLIMQIANPQWAKLRIVEPVVASLNARQNEADLGSSRLRMAHFLAQAIHETDGFHTLHEYASGAAYEWRQDLGNTEPGDGKLFKGRGIFQLTGRANYKNFGDLLKLDLVGNPEMAADPDVAVRVALLYWRVKKLNVAADADNIRAVTKSINGGYNGLVGRVRYLHKAKKALGYIS